ncbi:MAG: hypothetical protein QXH80_02550 [Candidatus Nanoarchaeia archaeon]
MSELTDEQRKSLFMKYKEKIEREVGQPPEITEGPDITYSEAYRIFKQEQVSSGHHLFERLCNKAEKILQIKLKQTEIDALLPSLEMSHMSATPQGVYALAALSTLTGIILSFVFGLLLLNFILIIIGLLISVSLFFAIPMIPKQIFTAWRAKASDQIVLAVLYMIIYMEHTPNLELATWFAAKHLPPPLSLDFIKVLWDVETKKYSNITAALEDYVETWRGWDDAFIDSIHVLETSLFAETKAERLKTLEKAEEIILDGTYDKMLAYAHNLQSPIQTLHMLGTVLPVMGLVMLPMVSAFMGASVKWWHIAILYNILLPLSVYAISKSVLAVRPAGANPADVYQFLSQKYIKPKVHIFGADVRISPRVIGILVAIAVAMPAVLYFLANPPIGSEAFMTTPLLFSTLFITALGLGLAAYYFYKVSHLIKIKKKIMQIENEFAAAMFQLGNRIGEGIPVEAAFSAVIEAMPKAEVADFFRLIDHNIRDLGMNLEDAIFDEKIGALSYYPSAIIKSVMHTLVEASKKSPAIAASSLITISKYLTNAHRVNERLQDLLADTISSMASQIKMFAPVISGIVVGLSALTTLILSSLGDKLRGFEASAEVPGFGTGLLQVFQIEHMMPSYQFQLIVGVYLVQIVIVMSYLLNGIVNGPDRLEQENMTAKNLAFATIFYAGLTAATTLLFAGLVSGIVEAI